MLLAMSSRPLWFSIEVDAFGNVRHSPEARIGRVRGERRRAAPPQVLYGECLFNVRSRSGAIRRECLR